MRSKIWIFLSIVLNIFISWQVYKDNYSFVLIFLWIFSVLSLIIFSTYKNINLKNLKAIKVSKKTVFILMLLLLPSIVRIFNYDLDRIHTDDLITAYFSAFYDLTNTNFFSAIPTDKGQWVSQFPTPYFALQKLFFLLFGETLLTIKLSILPYVFIVSLMIFLIAKETINEKTAVISVIIYSFFAPSLYIETLGLHFISSTAIFMVFFYFILLTLKEKKYLYSTLTGVFCGLSYLFYTSSYIAFPILVFSFITYLVLSKNRLLTVKIFLISIVGFLTIVSPYLVYMHSAQNYYLTQRINQVNLVSGEWSHQKDEIKKGTNPLNIILRNLSLSIKSLYSDGIGGHGGYSFNNLAFFDKITLFLFIYGITASLVLSFRKKGLLFTLLVIFLSYIFGVVLTIPPPAYHRFSLAYPFLAIIISIPLYIILSVNKISLKVKVLMIIFILFTYGIVNQTRFIITNKEDEGVHDGRGSLMLAKQINRDFSDRYIYCSIS